MGGISIYMLHSLFTFEVSFHGGAQQSIVIMRAIRVSDFFVLKGYVTRLIGYSFYGYADACQHCLPCLSLTETDSISYESQTTSAH